MYIAEQQATTDMSDWHTPDSPSRHGVMRDQCVWMLIGGLAYFLIASATIALTSDGRNQATVWPADAVILALLLSRPRRQWPALLLAGWLGNLLANGVTREWAAGMVLYGAINMGQTMLAAWFMRSWLLRRSNRHDDLLADAQTFRSFLAGAGVIAPVIGALAGAIVSMVAYGQPVGASFIRWFTASGLGFVIYTPFFMALFDGSYARAWQQQTARTLLNGLGLFALHTAVVLVVFGQHQVPILFLPFPTLLILSFALGRLATQGGVMLVAVGGVIALAQHTGPIQLVHGDIFVQTLFFQIYLAVLLCTALPVAAIVASGAAARTDLSEREEMLRLIMANSPDAILGLDGQGICRWADGPVRACLGLDPQALVGLSIKDIAGCTGPALEQLHEAGLTDETAGTVEFAPQGAPQVMLEASLRMAPHSPGQPVGSVITLRDMTVRKARELAISRRMETDDLTGVFNRAAFRQQLNRAIESPVRPLTLALLDVDHFKLINDTHGHPAGDAALIEIARRLLVGIREDDVVARLSGDEFAILFRCGMESARTICERITRQVAAQPIAVSGNVLVLSSISCGIAGMRGGMTRETLFDRADQALYEAKRSGRNVVRSVA